MSLRLVFLGTSTWWGCDNATSPGLAIGPLENDTVDETDLSRSGSELFPSEFFPLLFFLSTSLMSFF